MNFSNFAQEIYFYLLVASFYFIRSKLEILIHSIIHSPGCNALMNDLKSNFSEENICFGEHLQKMIISFLTVRIDEMSYGETPMKIEKFRNSHLLLFCKIRFFKNFAIFTEIQLCWRLFFNKVVSEL